MRFDSPIFVTGHHRSGKTLVRWLLDAHPNIVMSQRTQMWPRFYRAFGPLSQPGNLDRCLEAMRDRKQIARLSPDWERLRAEFIDGAPTYARLFALIHEQVAEREVAERWGDQSTNLDFYAERILEAHPEARFIHMLRDPFDAFEAFKEKGSRRLSGPGVFSAGWSRSARLASTNQEANPGRYRAVKYEDFVGNPHATASRIFDFIDEPFEEGLLQLTEAERYDPQRRESEHGWAVTSGYVGIGEPLDHCTAWSIADGTTVERRRWGYDHPVGAGTRPGGCLVPAMWNTATRLVENVRLSTREDPPREASSYSALMRAWHSVTDSERFRKAVKRGRLSPILKSDLYKSADIKRRQLLVRIVTGQPSFDDVATFTLFIGHNKSGTSLLGGLLDAHRRVVLSDEADALKFIEAGVPRDELFKILLRASKSEARKGRVTARRLGAYSYSVPGQWQGRAESPVVVGDSMSGTTTRKLAERPELIDAVEDCVAPAKLRVLQVIRNPFDPISLMVIRGNRSIANSVDHYFRSCERLIQIQEKLGENRVLQVYYEDLVAAPADELQRVLSYLGLEADPGHLEACARLVQRGFEDSRNRIDWDRTWIEEVEDRMTDYWFLRGYTFGSPDRGDQSG